MKTPMVTCQGYVLTVRDSGVAGKQIFIMTAEIGLLQVYIPQARRKKSRIGYLLPGAFLQITLVRKNNLWELLQVEGQIKANLLDSEYDDLLLFYYFVNWVKELFPREEKDHKLYHLVADFIDFWSYKEKRVLTLIASWQAIMIAGYDPTELLIADKISLLTEEGKHALMWILQYRWQDDESYVFTESLLRELSSALSFYAEYFVGMTEIPKNVFV